MSERPFGDAPADIAGVLRRVEAFGTCPGPLLSHLAAHSRLISVRKGATIFLAGDVPALYVLTRGRVAILSQPTPEVEIQLFVRQPYEPFGEASIFVGVQVDQARALEPVQAAQIEAPAVRAIMEGSPLVASMLAALIARRLASAQERIAELGVHGVPQRLLLLLHRLARDSRVADSRGALIPYWLTQAELSRLVGASRVAVNQALQRLREEGRITTSGRRIILRRDPPP